MKKQTPLSRSTTSGRPTGIPAPRWQNQRREFRVARSVPARRSTTTTAAATAPSRRTQLEWFLAGGIVVAAIFAVALVALSVCGGCLGGPTPSPSPTQVANATPTATPTATTSATAPGSTPTPPPSGVTPGPSQTVPPDVAAQIDEVVAQMPSIRELQPLRDVPYEFVSRDQFRVDLQQMFDEEVDPVFLAAQQRTLIRLALLPADADLRQLLLDLNGGAVAAYYRPDTGRFYVIDSGRPFGSVDRIYVAHEYTHALQDQHFDLEANRITDLSEGDAALAQLAAVEGDASTAMIFWANQYLTYDEWLEVIASGLTGTDQVTLDDMPPILGRQLTFPYNEGMGFVTAVQGDGGWPAVDELIKLPPPSTEQILHPEKFAAGEKPLDVDIADAANALGQSWTKVYEDTLGELNIQVLAAAGEQPAQTLPGMPSGDWPHAEAAAGWGGDRIAMWEGPDGGWAIGWRTAWDSPTDADEFAARVSELQSRFAGPTSIVRATDKRVDVLVASDQAILDDLAAALH